MRIAPRGGDGFVKNDGGGGGDGEVFARVVPGGGGNVTNGDGEGVGCEQVVGVALRRIPPLSIYDFELELLQSSSLLNQLTAFSENSLFHLLHCLVYIRVLRIIFLNSS